MGVVIRVVQGEVNLATLMATPVLILSSQSDKLLTNTIRASSFFLSLFFLKRVLYYGIMIVHLSVKLFKEILLYHLTICLQLLISKQILFSNSFNLSKCFIFVRVAVDPKPFAVCGP